MNAELATHVVTIALSFGVGVPILVKTLRARDRIVALIGASLVVDGAEWLFWLGYLCWPGQDPSVTHAFAIACRVGISAAVLCLGAFTWLTFRPESRAAACAFWASVAAMGGGIAGSGAVGAWAGFRADPARVWLETAAQILVYAWACAESLLYYRSARRRAMLGLTDPVVANRFALWGIYSGTYGGVQLSFLIGLASAGEYTGLAGLDIALTLIGVSALWLAFFPPRVYAAWLRRSITADG